MTPTLAAATSEGVPQRDSSALRGRDTTRRTIPLDTTKLVPDTQATKPRTATPAEDSARAESLAMAAARRQSMTIGNVGATVALGLFGGAAFGFLFLLLRAFMNGSSIEVETRWGGIGNAGGGWRLSSAFSYLLAALLFGGLFASTVWALLRSGDPPSSRSSAPATAPKDSSAKR